MSSDQSTLFESASVQSRRVRAPRRFRRAGVIRDVALLASLLASLVVAVAPAATASDEPQVVGTGDEGQTNPTRVLASVGDVWITQADVDLALGRSGQENLPPIPSRVLMATVDILASQHRALATLQKIGKAVSDSDVDRWLVDNSPPDLKLTADQALTARAQAARVSPLSYRTFIAFRLTWQKYLQTTVTDANLEKHFTNQQARFDGTRFQVEHLYIVAPPGDSPQRTAALRRLTELRRQIVDEGLDFTAAGHALSGEANTASPPDASADADAAQWITGSGPLMPAIVDQVLQTPVGETSPPFDSSQAVHVVRVLTIEPGHRTLDQAKEDVRKHMVLYLLDFLAKPAAEELPLVWQNDK